MNNYGKKEWWYSKYIHPKGTFPSLIIAEDERSTIKIINGSDNVLAALIQVGRQKSPRRNSGPSGLDLEDAGRWNLMNARVHWFCEATESRLGSSFRCWLSRLGRTQGDNRAKSDRIEDVASLERENREQFVREVRRLEDGVRRAAAENTSTKGNYLLGAFSIADIVAIPWLERASSQLFYYKQGFNLRDPAMFPVISAWFSAMESRISYQGTKGCFFTHNHAIPHSIRPCYFDDFDYSSPNGKLQRTQKSVDNCFATIEMVEMPPHEGLLDVDRSAFPCPRNGAHVVEAIQRVRKFQPLLGRKSPYGVAAFDLGVSKALKRLARQAGYDYDDAIESSPILAVKIEDQYLALRYFRDRFCAPRDMSFWAARSLRGACHEELGEMRQRLAPEILEKLDRMYCPIAYDNRADADPKVFVGENHWKHVPPEVVGLIQ